MRTDIKTLLIISIVIFSISGAVILLGALSKLQHWSFAGPLLIIGMCLQMVSYLFGAFTLIKYIRTK
jgi:1,4-dihydroxy-2-naphthoate octaprenyltransferase